MWNSIVSSFLECLNGLFHWREAISNNEVTHEIISDKKDLEKACNYAELAVELVQQRATFEREKDKRRFSNLVKKFRKLK